MPVLGKRFLNKVNCEQEASRSEGVHIEVEATAIPVRHVVAVPSGSRAAPVLDDDDVVVAPAGLHVRSNLIRPVHQGRAINQGSNDDDVLPIRETPRLHPEMLAVNGRDGRHGQLTPLRNKIGTHGRGGVDVVHLLNVATLKHLTRFERADDTSSDASAAVRALKLDGDRSRRWRSGIHPQMKREPSNVCSGTLDEREHLGIAVDTTIHDDHVGVIPCQLKAVIPTRASLRK